MTVPNWYLDELAHAGDEHLDPAYVAAYDQKSPTDWSEDIAALRALGIGATSTVVDLGAGTGAFAEAIAPHVARVIAVDVSEPMVAAMRKRGLEAVCAGFLSYDHPGDPPDAVYTRNALHHLPDFWKAIALERLARLLESGGVLRLRDLVYSFEPGEAEAAIEGWLAAAPDDPAAAWTAEELAEHVRREHSTFTWLLEPMLEHAGFEIHDRSLSPTRTYAAYTCVRDRPTAEATRGRETRLAREGKSTASAEPTTTVQRQHEPGQITGREPAPAEMEERDARVVAERSGRNVAMTEHSVVIAGGGPAGLMLAGELALAGVDAALVERRASQDLTGLRAGGLHARTIEVLDQRGIADRFLSQGQVAQVAGFAWIPLDISDFPTRHNYGLALWQNHIERILAEWIGELAVPIYRGREVTGLAQDDTGVDVELSDGESLRAQYLGGCDGGRSLIRKAAGIEFLGWDPTISHLIAEVEMAQEPEWGLRRDALGHHALGKLEDGKGVRVMVTEQHLGRTDEPTLRDLSEALIAVYGTDFGIHSPTWISRFTDMARQAASYRKGRVLLAGDAAHVHYPAGGQGLNIGVQDAVNLGWKLAQVVKGTSPESLLDTYHAERHPIAARVLRDTMAQVALLRTDDRTEALRDVVSELVSMEKPRRRLAAVMSGLDIHYDLGKGHPLLGRRMPDLDLVTANRPLRVFTLLHDARPVLLNLGEPGGFDITPWADRVQLVDAEYVGTWELPVIGAVTAPTAVLIRPDGYVAWVGDRTDLGLTDALTTWFGPPSAA